MLLHFHFFASYEQCNINHLGTKLYQSDLKTQFVPRSKHYASVSKPVC